MTTGTIRVISLSILLANTVWAGTMGAKQDADACWGVSGACWGTPAKEPYPWQKVMSLSLGPAWSSAGETQTITLRPNIQKTYDASSSTSTLVSGELFLGLQKQLTDTFYSQLGLTFSASSNATFNGDIWEDADPSFNNYTYQYKVNHAHVGIKGLLLADVTYIGRPYISASIGIGQNNAHDFSITPKLYQEIPAPAFQSNTTRAFTYTLGIGVQRALDKHWQMGCGYQFAAWGDSQLGKASGQTLGNGLYLNNIYTNSIQLNLTYIS